MGLDNIPNEYPCKKQGTAIMSPLMGKDGNPIIDDDGTPITSVDCTKTQEAGGCPYMKSYDKDKPKGVRTYGMFGSDCWYRGKYGNYLLEELGIYDETEGYSFYGALGDHSYKSPHECLLLADAIAEALPDFEGDDEHRDDLHYAEWYLRWAAENCGGLNAWY